MIRAAFCGDVLASFLSKVCVNSARSTPSAAVILRTIAVLIPPGCTVVTFTGCPASIISCRRASVNPRTANLAELYADWPGTLNNPNTLETLTTWPLPEEIRCGRNALVPLTTPQKSTSITRSMSLNRLTSTSPANAMPALL
jgi:hypothetical protein